MDNHRGQDAWFYFYNKPQENVGFHPWFGDGKDAVGCLEQRIMSDYSFLSCLINLCLRRLFHVYTGLTQIMLKRDCCILSSCTKLTYNGGLCNASPFLEIISNRNVQPKKTLLVWTRPGIGHLATFHCDLPE